VFSPSLELILTVAHREAGARRHTHLTLEHLLYALAHDPEGEQILGAVGVDLRQLRMDLDAYLTRSLEQFSMNRQREPEQTLAFRRVLQTAVLHVQSAGRDEVRSGDVLAALLQEPKSYAAQLLASQKDRAENVMIVDVLRNDLGRVCIPGSVRVPRLCRLERTGAVQHLVSTVTGRLLPGRDAFDLLAASFPGGSITGAPKIRAMEVIEALEPVRRGPYTGTALWIGADGALGSSILIRTFVADGSRLTLHVGGGMTWRSDPTEEWEETRAKAHGPLSALGAVEA